MVQMLSAEGMSTRAIAPIVGSNKETVRQDLAGANKLAPEPPGPVQGMDGKTYSRPEPTEQEKEVVTVTMERPATYTRPDETPQNPRFIN